MSLSAARHKARVRALQACYQQQFNPQRPEAVIAQFEAGQDMRGADLAYFRELVEQVFLGEGELDALYAPFLDLPPARLDPTERAILRLASYELRSRLDVPRAVIIDEAVRLARKFGATDSHKFVNGVLDRLADRLRAVEKRR
ncbi:MAG: N utilization substance protein B [Gammaproteobacteria bacterium]|nr:MAG: N utilization substance protein B [Gammaproteobacteria bacterium]